MLFDEYRQVNIEQLPILNSYSPIDDAQIDLWWVAENQRGQGIVNGPACQVECVEAVADEIGGHAGREIANIVTAQGSSAAARCQPERFFCGQSGGIACNA